MNGFEKQELETQGMMSKLFGSKPSTNALIEINNFLADNAKATDLTAELVQGFIKAWGAKFDSSNIENRSSMYRKVADHVYLSAQSKDDAVFNEAQHLASVLELPENLQRLADKGAKKVAYFARAASHQWRRTFKHPARSTLSLATITKTATISARRFSTTTSIKNSTTSPKPSVSAPMMNRHCATSVPSWISLTNLNPISKTHSINTVIYGLPKIHLWVISRSTFL